MTDKERLCRTCIYGDKNEYDKPCVIYSDNCQLYKEKKHMTNEMTNAEAREHLKDILADVPNDKCIDWIEALNQAIKALEQQPCGDCVARSEALDILDDFEEDVENGKFKTAYAKARERMCELPPVTPSYNSIKTDLKPCEDWKFYYKQGYAQAKRDLRCKCKWIPVSERLPQYGKEVLTCDSEGFIAIQSIECNVWDEYDYWENQNGDRSDIDEVIVWMPLPEPYKESEEV